MCAGTVEERSIVESVRAVLGGKGKFFEAQCTDVLPEERAIVACFPGESLPAACCWLY
jgi:NADH:ubiquinone reductase (non-electrogenic)